MLREYNYILGKANVAIDFGLAGAAFLAAHGIRTLLSIYVFPQYIAPSDLGDYGWLPAFLPFLTVAVLGYNGLYLSRRMRSRTRDLIRDLAVSCLQITALLMASIYVFSRTGAVVSRPLILLIPPCLFGLLALKNWLLRRFLMSVRARGFNHRHVVLVGSGEPLRRFIEQLAAHPYWGLRIEGILTDKEGVYRPPADAKPPVEAKRDAEPGSDSGWRGPHGSVFGHPLLGDLATAGDALFHSRVDEVVLIPHEVPLERLVPLLQVCEEMGVRTHLPLHYFEGQIARPVLDRFDEIPVVSYWPTREIGPALLFKYAFDRIGAAIILLCISPFMLALMAAIRLTSKRGEPIFFGQERCGLNGRPFKCWKFRTMYVDAEERKKELEALNEMSGPVFKIKNDPRVTPIGRILRKTSMDELPQFWNVLVGEMSLVGPRPPIPAEVRQYDRWQRRRLSMKPGITCLWQVMGRNKLSFETWMKLDLQYIDNWSLLLDFKILLRTVYVVFTGHGAM